MVNPIEVAGLSRRYGGPQGFEAVRDVSFTVRGGELFALLGTNGAGKTSTVEVLEGLARPSAGTVRVLGHDPYRERAKVRPRTGVMLQEGGFPSDLTAAETLRMWAGCTTGARPVAEALDLVGLAGRAGVAVKRLSGGERRRLDLAAALLGRPAVLFLDEPTTGLDPESRRATWDLVRSLLNEGTTVLLTTHYLEEAAELADRVAIMHAGSIVLSGTPAEIAAAQPSSISFELPVGVTVADLPALSGEWSTGPAGRTSMTTARLQADLGALLAWADARDLTLPGLDARSGSLEEAFLAVARRERATAAGPAAKRGGTARRGFGRRGDRNEVAA
ncbi:ABC transporter ATP-binding protein [Allostreptomyces psammosilenae]|uniref:ABC-2 type transport system ATP-binding protein n=1 Tax=Allostreptomyces psammosilenae TaxID=1892865 RepID=A0A852ZWU4_9ACTN|nr:ABC transporter ATP-binding protein [Allostreptomyces psammosilenae]NYI05204.1 ABC-2 type transport system ATP-binding protein [Allostreptomyces psammosilenae]